MNSQADLKGVLQAKLVEMTPPWRLSCWQLDCVKLTIKADGTVHPLTWHTLGYDFSILGPQGLIFTLHVNYSP